MKKKYYHFYTDDVIWAFRDVTRQRPASLFDNKYFGMLKKAHDDYGLKCQLNVFYRTDYFYGMDEFTLADMTDAYKDEFCAASDWLKFAFHALQEFPDYPHVNASYEDTDKLFKMIKREIVRFAGEKSMAYSVMPHWRPMSFNACKALYDNGVKIVTASVGKRTEYTGDPSVLPLGHAPRLLQNRQPETMLFTRDTRIAAITRSICSHNHVEDEEFLKLSRTMGYITDEKTGLKFKESCNGICINRYTLSELKEALSERLDDEFVGLANHEQYFYEDYYAHDPEYEEKIYTLAKMMNEAGFECIFFEDVVKE